MTQNIKRGRNVKFDSAILLVATLREVIATCLKKKFSSQKPHLLQNDLHSCNTAHQVMFLQFLLLISIWFLKGTSGNFSLSVPSHCNAKNRNRKWRKSTTVLKARATLIIYGFLWHLFDYWNIHLPEALYSVFKNKLYCRPCQFCTVTCHNNSYYLTLLRWTTIFSTKKNFI